MFVGTNKRFGWVAVAVLLASCSGGTSVDETDIDLFGVLAGGGFIEHHRRLKLGVIPGEGIRRDEGFWMPVPLVAGEGWLRPDRRGWHPVGERATLRYLGARAPLGDPHLQLELFRLGKLEGTVQVEVLMEGTSLGRLELGRDLPVPALAVPAELVDGEVLVELEFHPPVARPEPGSRPEVAMAGFRLWDPVGGEDDADEDPRSTVPFEVLPEARELVFAGAGGELIAPLETPGNARALELEVRCRGGEPKLVVTLIDARGELRVAESFEECGRTWQARSLAIDALAGLQGTLSLEVTSGPAGGRLEVRRPRLEVDAAKREPVGVAVASPAADRPDILLVILDAARGRQFGFAGYPRDTSPNLDRLAAESLVFEQAYSECATTSCSIPNLISGVPFLNVGTVFKGRKIPDEIVTLAEYLAPLGYRTVGISSNPNNSRARNSHQGFDTFEKIWGAHDQSARAAEVIAEQPADEPLFLQLHYLPPHTPYRPTAEFDLFTNASYRGPVGANMRLRPYSLGKKSFSPEDVEQLLGLYDGNLRRADDAVAAVFAAMEKAGRWDNTMVLLTADHGEAFGEHGAFSHNSTVFEEMIHVPFVLRLPGGRVPESVDVSRPVALADVVPTLLGRLGIPLRPEVWGVDLLAEPGPRFLFHRTHRPKNAFLATRSDRWKAIVHSTRQVQMLFDMEADPEERVDRAVERPLLLAGMTLRLRDFIDDWERRVPQPMEDVVLSDDDEAILRSLGYVD